MLRGVLIIGLILLLGITMFSFAQNDAEQITITTYYPSPYGVYKSLRIFPSNAAPGRCNSTNAGTQYYSGSYNTAPISANTMYYCNGANWVSMSGGMDCKRYRSAKINSTTSTDYAFYCPPERPYLLSCRAMDDNANGTSLSASEYWAKVYNDTASYQLQNLNGICGTNDYCDSTGLRPGLGGDMLYTETVKNEVTSGGVVYSKQGCWAYDQNHAHKPYRLDITCCSDQLEDVDGRPL